MTSNIGGLVLYEPPLDAFATVTQGLADRLEALLAAGDNDEVLVALYREVVG